MKDPFLHSNCYGKEIRLLPHNCEILFDAYDITRKLNRINTTNMVRKTKSSNWAKIYLDAGTLHTHWKLFLRYDGFVELLSLYHTPEARQLRRWLKINTDKFNTIAKSSCATAAFAIIAQQVALLICNQ